MSAFKTIVQARLLSVVQALHGFSCTFTRASDGSTQTVTVWDSLGEMLGAVDVKSERNVNANASEFSGWTPGEGDEFTPSDDSLTYRILKSSQRTNGTYRFQGWRPDMVEQT